MTFKVHLQPPDLESVCVYLSSFCPPSLLFLPPLLSLSLPPSFLFETESCVAQAGLELVIQSSMALNMWFSSLHLLSAGIIVCTTMSGSCSTED